MNDAAPNQPEAEPTEKRRDKHDEAVIAEHERDEKHVRERREAAKASANKEDE